MIINLLFTILEFTLSVALLLSKLLIFLAVSAPIEKNPCLCPVSIRDMPGFIKTTGIAFLQGKKSLLRFFLSKPRENKNP